MDCTIYGTDVRCQPTVHMENFTIANWRYANNGMKLCSMDIHGTYLEADLPEAIYMRHGIDAFKMLRE